MLLIRSIVSFHEASPAPSYRVNRLKRFFVLPWLLLCSTAVLHGLWRAVVAGKLSIAWLGALLAVVPVLLFMLMLARGSAPRTSRYLPIPLGLAVAGSLLALWQYEPLPALYALVAGLLGTLLYVFWYSRLGRNVSPALCAGAQLPPFRLRSIDGRYYTPTQAGAPCLLLFVRGAWCPLCVAQINEVAEQYQHLRDRGVLVFVIAWQSQEQSQQLAEKFSVPLIFCVDERHALAAELGLRHQNGTPFGMRGYDQDTFYPTVILTDRGGKIIYSDQTDNYRLRPDPAEYLSLLEGSR